MKLTESKSQLAQLMSEESILVEQRSNVSTAFFDVENRLLVVPEFKDDVSVNVMDLILSHECSHSLNTPPEQWKYAIQELKINKSILNVIEDNRIERIIKQRYPGLKRVYHFGYKELMDIDFFGLSKLNIDEINLVDRINLYSKVGYLQFISFTEEENKFVQAVDQTETFDDVIKVAKEIQDYMKESLKEEYESQMTLTFDDYGFGEGIDGDSQSMDMDEESLTGSSDRHYGEQLSSDYSYGNIDKLTLDDFLKESLKSYTQEASEENQKELTKNDPKQSMYVNVPDINLNKYIIDHKVISNRLKEVINKKYMDLTLYNKFKDENSSIISYIIKEFNLKKNAQGRKKVKISKTGDINLNKLYAYKVTDDIFKRSSTVPKEQNHGLVFFLDWSGSMTNYLNDTIKQLLVLLSFCRKSNIPFEVYAFTTNWYSKDSFVEKEREKNEMSSKKHGEMVLYPLHLMNLFSSRMSNTDFVDMSNILLNFNGYNFIKPITHNKYNPFNYNNIAPDWFSLGNTPLDHTLILSSKVMEEFKNRTKVQIANAVYLTDGESHGIQFNVEKEYENFSYTKKCSYAYSLNNPYYRVYLRDKKSKESVKINNTYNSFSETNQIVSFVKQFTDFKMVAFRLVTGRDLKKVFFSMVSTGETPDTKTFNNDNCIEIKTKFDKFYFVKANSLNDNDGMIDTEGKTASAIAKEFSKMMGSKLNNRVFLKKFVEVIS